MSPDGAVIAAALDAWGAPRVLADAFGTADPARVAGIVSAFCAEHLGAAVDRYEFFAGGVGTVHGVFDFAAPGGRIPTRAEMSAFVSDYETARGRPFSPAERALADAALVYQRAASGPTCSPTWAATRRARRPPSSRPEGSLRG